VHGCRESAPGVDSGLRSSAGDASEAPPEDASGACPVSASGGSGSAPAFAGAAAPEPDEQSEGEVTAFAWAVPDQEANNAHAVNERATARSTRRTLWERPQLGGTAGADVVGESAPPDVPLVLPPLDTLLPGSPGRTVVAGPALTTSRDAALIVVQRPGLTLRDRRRPALCRDLAETGATDQSLRQQ
jgi:hypothetical protein